VVRSHRDLVVWQRSIQLVKEIYRVSRYFPDTERYGLVSQLTRAAISVPANIAEGNARATRRDYAQFVSIARGSLAEVETYLIIAVELGYISSDEITALNQELDEIGRMLTALRIRLGKQPELPLN
jgi:four helix bundle protein